MSMHTNTLSPELQSKLAYQEDYKASRSICFDDVMYQAKDSIFMKWGSHYREEKKEPKKPMAEATNISLEIGCHACIGCGKIPEGLEFKSISSCATDSYLSSNALCRSCTESLVEKARERGRAYMEEYNAGLQNIM